VAGASNPVLSRRKRFPYTLELSPVWGES